MSQPYKHTTEPFKCTNCTSCINKTSAPTAKKKTCVNVDRYLERIICHRRIHRRCLHDRQQGATTPFTCYPYRIIDELDERVQSLSLNKTFTLTSTSTSTITPADGGTDSYSSCSASSFFGFLIFGSVVFCFLG